MAARWSADSIDYLAGFKLVPNGALRDGWIAWVVDGDLLRFSEGLMLPAPPEANTAYLSLDDYSEVTRGIANGIAAGGAP